MATWSTLEDERTVPRRSMPMAAAKVSLLRLPNRANRWLRRNLFGTSRVKVIALAATCASLLCYSLMRNERNLFAAGRRIVLMCTDVANEVTHEIILVKW